MSQAWRVARIHSFEEVPVGPTTGLLRVGAVTDTHAAPGDRRPTLLADDGLTVTRFAALPAPDDTGGTLRSAYSAPREIVSAQTVFSLEFDDGLVIALPTPTVPATVAAPFVAETEAEAGAGAGAEPFEADAGAELSPDPAAGDWWGLFASLLLEAAQARAELAATHELRRLSDPGAPAPPAEDPHGEYMAADAEARAAEAVGRAESAMLELAAERDLTTDLRAAQARAEHELREQTDQMALERDEMSRQASAYDEVAVRARERAASAEAEHQGTAARLAEMEVWSGELERRLTETTTELGEARLAAERDDADLQRLHGELAEARAELELFQTRGIGPTSGLPARPLPGPPRASLSLTPADLDEIRRDAFREAHRRADRDLADAGR